MAGRRQLRCLRSAEDARCPAPRRRADRAGPDSTVDAGARPGRGVAGQGEADHETGPGGDPVGGLGQPAVHAPRPDRLRVCWALAGHMRTELPLEALELAIWTRVQTDLTGRSCTTRTPAVNISRSATATHSPLSAPLPQSGPSENSHDIQSMINALAESTIGQVKAELVYRQGPWRSIDQLDSPSSGKSTGGITPAYTARSAWSHQPKPRPPTTVRPGHCIRPVPNKPSLHETQDGPVSPASRVMDWF
jgi:hypothetical protein